MVRTVAVFMAVAWAAVGAPPQSDGEPLFKRCEFKAAARAFERALASEPQNAALHYWLGKSYERMAEVASPLFARRDARKAQRHLEAAVRLAPDNREFRNELFEFYVDSGEWFDGGLDRAMAMLERFGPEDVGPTTASSLVAESRKEYRGVAWAVRKGILRGSALIGFLAPFR